MRGKRAFWHDYRGAGFTLVTLVTEPRRPLFGRITERGVELSPAGMCALECWRRIPAFAPQVETSTLCVMPDHLHGILCAREALPRPLGQVVRGYKSGVTAELRRRAGDAALSVWEAGWHDLVALEPASLHAYHDYILDNTRRWRLKAAHPDLFTRLNALRHKRLPPGRDWSGFGNLFLLDRHERLAVRVSRSADEAELLAWRHEAAAAFARGAVLVSPFISPGEKATVDEALAQPKGRVIVVKAGGFRPLYKPAGRYFDLCAAGRLLVVSPDPWPGRDEPLTRARCIELNALAAAIAGDTRQGCRAP